MKANEEIANSAAVRVKEGKYLTFALGHEEYGLDILGGEGDKR